MSIRNKVAKWSFLSLIIIMTAAMIYAPTQTRNYVRICEVKE